MFYSDIHIVVSKMNECAKQNIPFLFAFNFDLNEALFIENPSEQTEILFQTTLGGNSKPATALTKKTDNISFRSEPFDDYERRFNIVKQALQRGDSFLVNLTSRTPVSTNLSIKEIFDSTDAPYRLYVPERFVCFSPERFVLIQEDGTISTNPMKGTIDASLPNAEEAILSNSKETAEHATVVDLLRNDISMNASNVHVARYRYITLIKGQEKSILQVSSEIKGQLSADWRSKVGDIILDMLPAGSISGAPKNSTVATIKKAEATERGFYTGVFGYYDGKSLDSGVLIRFIEQDADGDLYFRSGGGITAKSDVKSEYEEVKQKIYLPTMEPKFSEVICVRDGEPQHIGYHIQRMNRTTNHFFGSDIEVPDLSKKIPDDAKKGKYKCRIVYGKKIESIEFTPYEAKMRKSVAIIEDNNIDYTYKSTNRDDLKRLVAKAGTDDVIIIRNGMVTDVSYCNVVFEDADGGLFTPEETLLNGTCRQRLLDNGIIKMRKIRREDIHLYSHIYFINAMMDINECQKMDVKDIQMVF